MTVRVVWDLACSARVRTPARVSVCEWPVPFIVEIVYAGGIYPARTRLMRYQADQLCGQKAIVVPSACTMVDLAQIPLRWGTGASNVI